LVVDDANCLLEGIFVQKCTWQARQVRLAAWNLEIHTPNQAISNLKD
jgi:hypothetical protein